MRVPNQAHAWVLANGWKSVEEAQSDYECACIDFAGDFLFSIGRGRLAYFETPLNAVWRYHAAAEIDGMIHDLWHPHAIPLRRFMKIIGATEVDYPADEPQCECEKV